MLGLFYFLIVLHTELLIILGLHLEVCAGMSTNGALLGSGIANVQVTAVATLPDALIVAAEHCAILNVSEQFLITFLVSLLNIGYKREELCNFVETLLGSLASHCGIHLCPLVVLAFGSVYEVIHCLSNAVVQQLEPDFCMLFLLVGCLLKESKRTLKIKQRLKKKPLRFF